MKTARYIPSQIWTIAQIDTGNAVFVRAEDSNLVLPVYVSESDTQCILVELMHILAPRPMVHELLLSAINALGGALERVEIYGIRSGSYLCRIVLVRDRKEFCLESRPSDILCLSARTDCPVYVMDEVFAKNGIPAERVSGDSAQSVSAPEFSGAASLLKKELEEAVDREDYENAIRIRDLLAAAENSPLSADTKHTPEDMC